MPCHFAVEHLLALKVDQFLFIYTLCIACSRYFLYCYRGYLLKFIVMFLKISSANKIIDINSRRNDQGFRAISSFKFSLFEYLKVRQSLIFLTFLKHHFYRKGCIALRTFLLDSRIYVSQKTRLILLLTPVSPMSKFLVNLRHYFKIRRRNKRRIRGRSLKHTFPVSRLFFSTRLDNHNNELCLRLTMHKRQQYFIWSDYPQWNIVVYSSGRLLSPISKTLKYYKKVFRNISILLIRCRNILRRRLRYVYILFCKNYNYKQYSWVKKYLVNVKPSIVYSVLTHSWQYSPKGVRRVKRTVYRNILKIG